MTLSLSTENNILNIIQGLKDGNYHLIFKSLNKEKDLSFLNKTLKTPNFSETVVNHLPHRLTLAHYMVKNIYCVEDDPTEEQLENHKKIIQLLIDKKIALNENHPEFGFSPLDMVFLDGQSFLIDGFPELFKNLDVGKRISSIYLDFYKNYVYHMAPFDEAKLKKTYDIIYNIDKDMPLLFAPLEHLVNDWVIYPERVVKLLKYFLTFQGASNVKNLSGNSFLSTLTSLVVPISLSNIDKKANSILLDLILFLEKNELTEKEQWNDKDFSEKKPFHYFTNEIIKKLPQRTLDLFEVDDLDDLSNCKSSALKSLLEKKLMSDIKLSTEQKKLKVL